MLGGGEGKYVYSQEFMSNNKIPPGKGQRTRKEEIIYLSFRMILVSFFHCVHRMINFNKSDEIDRSCLVCYDRTLSHVLSASVLMIKKKAVYFYRQSSRDSMLIYGASVVRVFRLFFFFFFFFIFYLK